VALRPDGGPGAGPLLRRLADPPARAGDFLSDVRLVVALDRLGRAVAARVRTGHSAVRSPHMPMPGHLRKVGPVSGGHVLGGVAALGAIDVGQLEEDLAPSAVR
jgi:hypothetical protein